MVFIRIVGLGEWVVFGTESFDCDRTVRFFYIKKDFGASEAINVDLEIKGHTGNWALTI